MSEFYFVGIGLANSEPIEPIPLVSQSMMEPWFPPSAVAACERPNPLFPRTVGQAFEKASVFKCKATTYLLDPEAQGFIPSRTFSLLDPRAKEFRSAVYTSKAKVLAEEQSKSNGMNPAVANFRPRAWTRIPICDKTELLRLEKSNTSIVPLDESCSLQAIQQSQKGQFIKRKVLPAKPMPKGPRGVEATVRKEGSEQYNGFLELNRQNHRSSLLGGSQCIPHHINWLGEPVDDKSQTPAALSLAIICSESKGLQVEAPETLQKSVPFNNAMQLIDPVVYIGSKADLEGLSGTALQEVATGATYKVYSPTGWWHDMDSEHWFPDEEMPRMDTHEDERLYKKDVVLNGWVENHGLPTRRTFVANEFSKNEQIKSASHEKFIKKMGKAINKSSLRESVSSDESEIVMPTTSGSSTTVSEAAIGIQPIVGTNTKDETNSNSAGAADDGCRISSISTGSESFIDDIQKSPVLSPELTDDTDDTDVASDDEMDPGYSDFSEGNLAQFLLEDESHLAPELSSVEQHQVWASSKEVVVFMPGSDTKLKIVVRESQNCAVV